MDKIELEQNIDRMQKELDSMKDQLKEADKDKLHLTVSMSNYLIIRTKYDSVGFISDEGSCHIINTYHRLSRYEKWREDGMPIDTESIVEWRGGKYKLNSILCLIRIDVSLGAIYDFEDCERIEGCEDPNVIRHKHNNRPVGF